MTQQLQLGDLTGISAPVRAPQTASDGAGEGTGPAAAQCTERRAAVVTLYMPYSIEAELKKYAPSLLITSLENLRDRGFSITVFSSTFGQLCLRLVHSLAYLLQLYALLMLDRIA